MPTYRLELAKTNRGGCNQTLCKKQGVKIGKDCVKFGTWVTAKDNEFWSWKHWGCVTPRQIESLKENMADEDGELDYDMLDGYEDLGDDDRAKVRQALKDGHVADEDALGANKPSVQAEQTSLKQSVKEAKNEVKKLQTAVDKARNKGDEDAEEKATKSLKAATTHLADVEQSLEASLKISQDSPGVAQPTPAKPKGKRAKKDADGEENGDATPAKKKRAKSKKEADDEDNDDADKPAPAKKQKRSRAKKAEVAEDDEDDEPEPEPAPKRRKSAKAKEAKANEDEDEEDEEGAQPKAKPKPKRAARKKA